MYNFQTDPESFWNVFYTVMYNFQADPGSFWNVFYTVMFVLMMLYFYKTRRRSDWDSEDDLEVRTCLVCLKPFSTIHTGCLLLSHLLKNLS